MALITFVDDTYRDERGASVATCCLILASLALAGAVADATPAGHEAANFVLEHVNRAIAALR
jgi:hypothetical protein